MSQRNIRHQGCSSAAAAAGWTRFRWDRARPSEVEGVLAPCPPNSRGLLKRALKLGRQLLALLLALAWVPLLHSCELAHALGFEIPHQDPCHENGGGPNGAGDHCHFCLVVDSDGVLSMAAKVSLPDFPPALILWTPELAPLAIEPPSRAATLIRSDQNGPPPRWQFAERAALPPRAPSTTA